jgi:hypothetical protein
MANSFAARNCCKCNTNVDDIPGYRLQLAHKPLWPCSFFFDEDLRRTKEVYRQAKMCTLEVCNFCSIAASVLEPGASGFRRKSLNPHVALGSERADISTYA